MQQRACNKAPVTDREERVCWHPKVAIGRNSLNQVFIREYKMDPLGYIPESTYLYIWIHQIICMDTLSYNLELLGYIPQQQYRTHSSYIMRLAGVWQFLDSSFGETNYIYKPLCL